MTRAIRNVFKNRHVFKNSNFSLTECNDGYYIYDYVLEYNIVMRAVSEHEAFNQALCFYQKKLAESKLKYKDLDGKVKRFIGEFDIED